MQRNLIPLMGLLLAAAAAIAHAASAQQEFRASEIAVRNAAEPAAMQRYIIERNIPNAGELTLDELRSGAAKSNGVLREMGSDIQRVRSYIAGDKVYCVYNATSEALIREHAQRSGFPANLITPVALVVDPTTARR
jgi:hypothetical protein